MATKIIGQTAPTAHTLNSEAVKAKMRDISTMVTETRGLASLCLWINDARHLIETVRDCSRIDPVLEKSLQQNCVPVCMAEWDDDAACGMQYLIIRQRVNLDAVAEIADDIAYQGGCRG
ncbi:hypothetical protein [Variovorax sp. DXTD-1]|uniref:hypothetical protein n=1 Tax=Variovorax sp. DXTD-1 TaxID=2495592 RepID=UPI000F86D2F2|nr:hypothetical protein [Variovorax sp. DXTD-1]RST51586.1 hypothetical protein EJI00_08410 [Variovorax sp. DXTD-1]